MTHLYYGIILSHKKDKILATWIDLENSMLNEISQSEESYDFTHMGNTKQKLIATDNSIAVIRGKEAGG